MKATPNPYLSLIYLHICPSISRKSGLRDVDAQWLQPQHKAFLVAVDDSHRSTTVCGQGGQIGLGCTGELKAVHVGGGERLVGGVGLDMLGGGKVRNLLPACSSGGAGGVQQQQRAEKGQHQKQGEAACEEKHASIHHLTVRDRQR